MESVDEAEGRQGELSRKEQSLKASQKTAVLGWPPPWNGLIPRDNIYLFVLSQILVRQLAWLWDAGTLLLGCAGLGGFLIHCRCSIGIGAVLISAATSHGFSLRAAPAF